MTEEIKRACLDKAKAYKRYVKNGRTNIDQLSLHNFASYSENLISDAKTRYLSSLGEKLNNPQIGCKTYKFMHKKKIPLIPPILLNNIYITDISEKAHLFNVFFANQCKIIQNKSTLPVFGRKTVCMLDSIIFDENRILSIIRSHGFDNISTRMIKICDKALVLPLLTIFKTALRSGIYPDQWKKAKSLFIKKKANIY